MRVGSRKVILGGVLTKIVKKSESREQRSGRTPGGPPLLAAHNPEIVVGWARPRERDATSRARARGAGRTCVPGRSREDEEGGPWCAPQPTVAHRDDTWLRWECGPPAAAEPRGWTKARRRSLSEGLLAPLPREGILENSGPSALAPRPRGTRRVPPRSSTS